MKIKKIISLNDICAYGKVSLTISIPIFSKLGIQLCPLPTGLFSSHTQFPSFYYTDLSEHLVKIVDEWKKLKLSFDGFYIGYLVSERENELAKEIVNDFETGDVVIDPILGDNGKLYSAFNKSHVDRMRELVSVADMITPNVTEAALLLEKEYEKNITLEKLSDWAKELSALGPKKIVITSVESDGKIGAFGYDNGATSVSMKEKINLHIPGTGDAFSSAFFAYYLNGLSFEDSIDKAATFVTESVREAFVLGDDALAGIAIEKRLSLLK